MPTLIVWNVESSAELLYSRGHGQCVILLYVVNYREPQDHPKLERGFYENSPNFVFREFFWGNYRSCVIVWTNPLDQISYISATLHTMHVFCFSSCVGGVGCSSSLSKACLPLYLWNCPPQSELVQHENIMYVCMRVCKNRTPHLSPSQKKAKYIQAKPTTRLYHTHAHTQSQASCSRGTKRTKRGAAGHAAKGHGRRPARKGRQVSRRQCTGETGRKPPQALVRTKTTPGLAWPSPTIITRKI